MFDNFVTIKTASYTLFYTKKTRTLASVQTETLFIIEQLNSEEKTQLLEVATRNALDVETVSSHELNELREQLKLS